MRISDWIQTCALPICQGWAFFNEVRADYDWKRLAHSMVPMSQDKNAEEWNDFGRLLLRETAKKLHQLQGNEASVMDLFRLCTIEDPKVLKQFLEGRSEEHTSELQSLMPISYAVF